MRLVTSLQALVLIISLLAPSFSFAAGGHGGPSPTPTHTPTPTPTPTQPPGPDLGPARQAGLDDGRAAGSREGSDRGPVEGRNDGIQAGRNQGFDRCDKEESQRAYNRGFEHGYRDGQDRGAYNGDARGRQEGSARGQSDGNSDGLRRADSDAVRDATPAGRQQGYDQANASDAVSRGQADGTQAGDKDAQDKANSEDYPRGRQDYRNERWNEAVVNNDAFNQRSAPTSLVKTAMNFMANVFAERDHEARQEALVASATGSSANPDNRYYSPSRTFPTQAETDAYKSAYSQGYANGFRAIYGQLYDSAYSAGSQAGQQQGCQEARQRDHRDDQEHGEREGRDRGYHDGYDRAYRVAYQPAYNQYYRAASDDAYRNNYQGYYNQHFEEARSRAYSERVGQLYNSAFARARDAKFNAVYAGYADAAYKRGRADEAADFADRPIRLTDAQVTETIPNAVFEPGEALRIKFQARSFANGSLSGGDITVQVQALDANAAVISVAQESLAQNVKRLSVTTVGEALEFRMNENSVNRAQSLRVTLLYQGKNVGEKIVQITPKFMIDVQFAESPTLKEGIESSLKIKVRNQSNVATDAGLKISFSSDPNLLEIRKSEAQVGILNPGEERVVEFPVVARQGGSELDVPMVFLASNASGRRVGLIDGEQRIPLVNDYRVGVTASVAALRNAGITRVEYTLQNISSRLLLKGLQLKATVLNDTANNFVVVGPNPQYLTPMIQGQSLSFVIPVMAKEANQGGVLQLEIQEDGRSVIISRTNF